MRAVAQEKTIVKTNQQWIHYFLQLKLSEPWTLVADGSYRWRNGFEERTQYVLRLMTNFRITPALMIGGGMAYSATYGPDGVNRVEFRPFQDLSLRTEFRYFELIQRFRMEERFTNPAGDGRILTPNTFKFRFRYALSANVPLFSLSKINPEKSVAITIGDEILLNAGKSVITNVFDQNRFFIGPTLKWNKNFSSAILWNKQFASTVEPSTYRRTHVLWLQIRHHLN
jgi:hypothetical protein